MNKINNGFSSIEQVTNQYLSKGKNERKVSSSEEGQSFLEILQQTQLEKTKESTEVSTELKFSKHASMRMEQRNISLTDEQLERLESGTQEANEKGIKESLIMVDRLAFIVNVPSNTVITAMDQEESGKNVFTNIDGAVIM